MKAQGLCKVSEITTGDGQYLHVTETTESKANSLSVSSASPRPQAVSAAAASPSSSPPPEVGTAKESGVNASLVAGVGT